MKRVVWAYADWTGKGEHDLAKSTWQLYLLIAGVLSWMKFAPTYWRVIYVDKSIYEFLKEKNLLELYNEVQVVDFKKEIVGRFNVNFFAFPKMWAYTKQESPFFICDTDVVLQRPLDEWFDDTKYWGWLYNHTNNLPLGTSEREREFTRKEWIEFQNTCTRTPGLRNLCDFTNCVNGGLIYFPDPKKAQILGYTMMSLAQEIVPTHGDWVLYEEALIPTILKNIGVEMTPQPMKARIEECGMGKLEEYPKVENMIKGILGFDLKEWYPELEF